MESGVIARIAVSILSIIPDLVFSKSIEDQFISESDIDQIINEVVEDSDLPQKILSSAAIWTIFESPMMKPLIVELFTDTLHPRSYNEIHEEILTQLNDLLPPDKGIDTELIVNILLESILRTLRKLCDKNFIKAHNASEAFHRKKEKYIQYPAFENPTKYFSKNEPNLVTFDLPTQSSLIIRQNINLFLNSTDKFFLLLAQGGSGKSHILKEIGLQVQRDNPNIFVKILIPVAYDGIQSCENELNEREKYIILIDDADAYLEKTLDFLLFVKQCKSDIHVIISVRQSDPSELQVKLDERILSECVFKEPFLIQWTDKDLLELLHTSSELACIPDEALIIELYQIPSLLVHIGSLVKDGESFEIDDVLQKITKRATTEITQLCKPEVPDEQIEDYLGYLTTFVPFNKENPEILEFFQKTFHLSGEKFNWIMKRLEASKFFVSSSYARFNPDIIGVQILKNWINHSDRLISDLSFLDNFPLSAIKLIFRNLGSALDEEKYHTISGILEEYIDKLINSAHVDTSYQYEANLKIISHIAHIVPDSCYDLLSIYIEQIPSDEKERVTKFGEYHSIRPDIFQDLIEVLLSSGYSHVKVYTIIRKIHSLNLPAGTSGDLFTHWIKYAVSYQHCSHSSISNFIDFFKDEIDKNDDFALKFCETIIHRLLSFSYERTYCIYLTVHMAEYPFILSDEIIKIRMQAIDLLVQMLNASTDEMGIIAIHIVEHHCWYSRLNLSYKYLQQEALERQVILRILSSKADSSDNFAVRALIENLFLEWWGRSVPGGEEIPNYLKIFIRPPEYLALKILFFPGYFVPDFIILEMKTPKEGRWSWLVDNLFYSNDTPSSGDIEQYLINPLVSKIKSCKDIYEFFQYIDRIRALTGMKPRNMEYIIQQWVKMQFNVFCDLKKNERYWQTLPFEYQNLIFFHLAKLDSIYIDLMGDEIFEDTEKTDYDKIKTLLTLLCDSSIERETSDYWIERLQKKKDKKVNFMLLSHLYWICIETKDFGKITNIVVDIISEFETIDDGDWEKFENALFKFFTNDFPEFEKEQIREVLLNKIIINKNVYPDHTGFLYCIQTVDDLIALVDKRLDYLLHSDIPPKTLFDTRNWYPHSWTLPQSDCSDVERLLNAIVDWLSERKLPTGCVIFLYSLISCEEKYLIQYLSKNIDCLSSDALASIGGLLHLSEASLEIIAKILDKLSIENGGKNAGTFLTKVSKQREAGFLISTDQMTIKSENFLALLESLKQHLTSTKGKITVREREREIKSELQWGEQLTDRIKNSGGEW